MKKLGLISTLLAFCASFVAATPAVYESVYQGESVPLSELAKQARSVVQKSVDSIEIPLYEVEIERPKTVSLAQDPLRQLAASKSATTPGAPRLSFEGTTDADNGVLTGILIVPPDTNGDVGRDFYAQMNNIVFEIFSKADGSSVLGPLPNNIFFAGSGSFCEVTNSGDPIVLYDHDAKRWVFSQFALIDANLNSHQCFAVSQTSDPLGAYFLYDFVVSTPVFGGIAALNDYPKIGLWRNGYYASFNEFEFFPGFGFFFVAASAVAFERDAMLSGAPASAVKAFLPFTGSAPVHFGIQPSHWELNKKPKKDQPNVYVQAFDDQLLGTGVGPDGYFLWEFLADFDTPANSIFNSLGLVPSTGFDKNICLGRNCIDQPAPGTVASGNGLDVLDINTMYRAQWTGGNNQPGGGDSIVVIHDVNAGGGIAGQRWVELRSFNGSPWTIFQEGTYAPADGENRWMGSIAKDKKGNIAIGYSVSSLSTFPSVRYTGRLAGDPAGEMGVEVECHAGTGSQINSGNRWGDYSALSIDPKNGCEFWYTNEYYDVDGSFDFKTRVCSFRLPGCNSGAKDDSDSD